MKRPHSELESGDKKSITDHYSSRPDAGIHVRQQSKIYRLRGFNNWIKYILIETYCKAGDRVFDIAGGKGGDLLKWRNRKIAHLILADGARGSVVHAENRYRTFKDGEMAKQFPALFIATDCFSTRIFPKLDPAIRFDVVSCQFAFHYAFETEARLRRALENVTDRLLPGGTFIGTVPNAYRLVKLVRNTGTNVWSNSVCRVEFDSNDMTRFPAFGARYLFSLLDAVDNVPEYLVHFDVFERIAAEYHLELVERKEFPQIYQDEKDTSLGNLLVDMNVIDFPSGESLSADEWDASALYVSFAFRKKPNKYDEEIDNPPLYQEDYTPGHIIDM